MATKDEALNIAIEVMQAFDSQLPTNSAKQAIQACKEALEQPTMTYEQGFDHGWEARLAEEQPAQEPVAFRNKTTGEFCTSGFEAKHLDQWTPLYTHPAPSWQGLSDGEIQEHLGDELVTLHGWSFVQGVRWADKKLKEKNYD